MKRSLLYLAVVSVLAACGGGGGDENLRVVGHYGDSVAAGNLGPGNLHPTPVEYSNQISTKCTHKDYSRGALTSDMVVDAFKDKLALAPDNIVLLRYGGADVLLGGNLEVNTIRMIDDTRALGRTPVILTIINGNSEPVESKALAFNEMLKRVGAEKNVQVIDVRKAGPPEYDPIDGLHPGRAWSDRISQLIVNELGCV